VYVVVNDRIVTRCWCGRLIIWRFGSSLWSVPLTFRPTNLVSSRRRQRQKIAEVQRTNWTGLPSIGTARTSCSAEGLSGRLVSDNGTLGQSSPSWRSWTVSLLPPLKQSCFPPAGTLAWLLRPGTTQCQSKIHATTNLLFIYLLTTDWFSQFFHLHTPQTIYDKTIKCH